MSQTVIAGTKATAVEICEDMQSFAAHHGLIDFIAHSLREQIGANVVRFDRATGGLVLAPAPKENEMLIRVAIDGRVLGLLRCAARADGSAYTSEEQEIVQAIADQLGVLLTSDEDRRRCEDEDRWAREEAEMATREELRLLRARIDPEFLISTLDVLSQQVGRDAKRTERLLVHLSTVMRGRMAALRGELTTLSEEVSELAAYFELARARLGGRLIYEIRVPLILYGMKLPRLLLAPLIENAVQHGLAPRGWGGRITVGVTCEEGSLHFRVSDDGEGFDPETTRQSLAGLIDHRRRVEEISGPGNWRLTSEPGKGTTIEFEMRSAEC